MPDGVTDGVTGGEPSDDSNDSIDALAGHDVVSGGGGEDTIDGGSGNDVLIGGADNDRLDGGDGVDIYVFTGDHGDDTITAFANGADLINLAAYGLSGIDDVTIAQDGPNTVISGYGGFGETNTITLENFQSSDLGAEDFIFNQNPNVIVGTLNDDNITPAGVSEGVTGDIPSNAADIIKAQGGIDTVDSGGGDGPRRRSTSCQLDDVRHTGRFHRGR